MIIGHALRLCGIGLCVAACTDSRAASLAEAQQTGDSLVAGDLFFQGSTRIWGARGDSISVVVRLTNRGETTVQVEYGACLLDPRLYAAERGGERLAYAWRLRPDSSLRRLSDGSIGAVFPACLRALEPGAPRAPPRPLPPQSRG